MVNKKVAIESIKAVEKEIEGMDDDTDITGVFVYITNKVSECDIFHDDAKWINAHNTA